MTFSKIGSFLIFLLLVQSASAVAGIGRRLPVYEVFEQQCLLQYGDDPKEICSGVLIDQTQILTAAHCVAEKAPSRVFCGPQLKEVKVMETHIHPDFHSSTVVGDQVYLVKDIALLKLSERILALEVPLVSLREVSAPARCAFFGFSKVLRSGKSPSAPEFGWELKRENLQMWSSYELIEHDGWRAPGALSEPGDSGGPLMCQLDGKWHLLGVASSRDFSYHSFFTPVIDEKFPIRTGEVSKEIQRQTSQERNLFIDQALKNEKEALLNKLSRFSFLEEELEGLPSHMSGSEVFDWAIAQLFVKHKKRVGRLKTFSVFSVAGDASPYSIGDLAYNYFEITHIDFEQRTVTGNLKFFGPSDVFMCNKEILCREGSISSITTDLDNLEIYATDKMP